MFRVARVGGLQRTGHAIAAVPKFRNNLKPHSAFGGVHLRGPQPARMGLFSKSSSADDGKTIADFTATSWDGKEVALSQYKGKVLYIVNVATK